MRMNTFVNGFNFTLVVSLILFSSCKTQPIERAESFIDIRDNQVYKIVKIGNQIWMKENLQFNDSNDTYNYQNMPSNSKEYGKLYSWYSANKVCPRGWKLPSKSDFDELTLFLGGAEIAGGSLKATGTNYWHKPNLNATDSSGFSALPAGGRGCDGRYNSRGISVAFWTSSSVNGLGVFYNLWNNTADFRYNEYAKTAGFSVRCIKK